MPRLQMIRLKASNMLELYRQRKSIDLNPPYQRLSVWDREKQERFVDSIINGFDIPKMYFHELPAIPRSNTGSNESRLRYSVIDGKQRLLALWAFVQGHLTLPDDFVFFDDDTIHAGGARYTDLMTHFPTLRARFDGYDLPVTIVRARDPDFIESLFWRLNIQVPLSAPERRNALGAPLPYLIRRLAVSSFFSETASRLPNGRLQHYDVAAKFLYITRADAFVSTKRETLDGFVREFKRLRNASNPAASSDALDALECKTMRVLDDMSSFFTDADPLLSRIGRVTLYFHVFRLHRKEQQALRITRSMLVQFDAEVTAARKKADRRAAGSNEPMSSRETYLREFDRHKQSVNDAGALRQQYGYLRRYVAEEFEVEIPEND